MSDRRVQLRRDTAANWTANDPTLAAAEFGYETDTGKFKLGDGSTAWTSLAYLPNPTITAAVSDELDAVSDQLVSEETAWRTAVDSDEIVLSDADVVLASNIDIFDGLARTNGNFIVGDGSTFVVESDNVARTSLGVGTGDSPEFAGCGVGTSDNNIEFDFGTRDHPLMVEADDLNEYVAGFIQAHESTSAPVITIGKTKAGDSVLDEQSLCLPN